MAENINDFIAGIVGGSAGIIVGQPLDVVRIRMQTQGKFGSKVYLNTWRCISDIARTEGLRSFYRGLAPPLVGLAGLNSVVFGSYGFMKRFLQDGKDTPLSLMQIYECGVVVGFCTVLITTPTELIKCRAQVFLSESQLKQGGNSTFKVGYEIYKHFGIRGLFSGLTVTTLRDVPSFGVYFAAYEFFKRKYIPDYESTNVVTLREIIALNVAGGLAGALSWLVVYPVDMVKSRLQTQPLVNPEYTGIIDCFKKVYRAEGPKAFSNGLTATLLRAFPLNAITFFVYELTMRFLETVEEEL